jgi:hypothetical protein
MQIRVAHPANFNLDQNFTVRGFGKSDILDLSGVLKSRSTAAFIFFPRELRLQKTEWNHPKNSGLDPSKEKLYGAAYSICELVRSGQIDRPLPYDSVVEAFHEFR